MLDVNKSLIENAYVCWTQHDDQNETSEQRINSITDKIFNFIKKSSIFHRLFSSFSKLFIKRDVIKALSAYKFDLIGTKEQDKYLRIFSKKEEWFIQSNLAGVLKNILIKPTASDRDKLKSQIIDKKLIEKKAKRWEEKTTKYHKKQYFMVANALLYLSTRQLPHLRGFINKSKTLGKYTIQKLAPDLKKLDPSVFEGLKRFLGDPNLDPDNPKYLLLAIKILQAKSEIVASNLKNRILNGFAIIGSTVAKACRAFQSAVLSIASYTWQTATKIKKQCFPEPDSESEATQALIQGLQQEPSPGFQSP